MVTSSGSIVFFTSDTSVHNVVFLSKLASQYKALKCKVVLSEDGFKFDISASHPIGTMVKDLMVDGDGKNARLFDSIVTSDTEVLVSCSGISYPAIFKFIEQERDWVTSMGITRLNTMLKTSINQDLRTISEGLDDDILYLRHKNGTHSYAFGVKDARKLKKTGLVVKEKVDDSLARYSRRNRIRPWLQLDESEFLGFKEYTIPVQSDISGSNSTLALALNHLILSNRKSGVEHFISLFVENREEKRDALHNLYVYIDSNVLKQLAVRLSLPEDFIKKCLGASFKAALSDDTLQIEAELFCREK